MQKGFATLEVGLVLLIIAVLASCAVPNAARVLDSVSLDCETKRLYTELRRIQSYDRMAFMNDSHNFDDKQESRVSLIVSAERYSIKHNDSPKIYGEHHFLNGVTASKGKSITFDDMGKIDPGTSDTIDLTSRLGKRLYFVFDTVGRFRGSRTKPQ